MQRPVGRATDPAFKEVSYGEQLRHPRGITTSNLEQLLQAKARGEHQQTFLLDVREQAETEIGTMAGALKARTPDIKTSGIDFANKVAILIDDDGNRSY